MVPPAGRYWITTSRMPVSASAASAATVAVSRRVVPGPVMVTAGGVQSAAALKVLAALAVLAVNAADANAAAPAMTRAVSVAAMASAVPARTPRAGGGAPSSSGSLSRRASISAAVPRAGRAPYTPATTASRVARAHRASAGRFPVPSHRPGSPIRGTRSRAWPVICPRTNGVLSGSALASPAVTYVPSVFSATIRWSRVFSSPSGSADAGLVYATTPPTGTGSPASKPAARTTSPALMWGSIDPLWTTLPCQPDRAGSTAIAARARSTRRYSRDASDTRNKAQPSFESKERKPDEPGGAPGLFLVKALLLPKTSD
ncbi:MAG: hypothetical protein JWO49_2858 [Arthrobacter sp.]|nr:hypothetical protein [Arthrobacter sp.]MCU1548091.1 hypothetical protein [Arthrobacter sp.]